MNESTFLAGTHIVPADVPIRELTGRFVPERELKELQRRVCGLEMDNDHLEALVVDLREHEECAPDEQHCSCASVLADMGVKRDPMIDTALAQLQMVASDYAGRLVAMATCRTCGMELTNKAQCWSCQRSGLALAEDQAADAGEVE